MISDINYGNEDDVNVLLKKKKNCLYSSMID